MGDETTQHGVATGKNCPPPKADYGRLVTDISGILEQARRAVARSTNGILAATYWDVGRRIVEYEQGGKAKAEYGKKLIARLAIDLTARHGRGFSRRNVEQMRAFYLGWEIAQTPSAPLEARTILPASSGRNGWHALSPSSFTPRQALHRWMRDTASRSSGWQPV